MVSKDVKITAIEKTKKEMMNVMISRDGTSCIRGKKCRRPDPLLAVLAAWAGLGLQAGRQLEVT